jgi:hypothetical protein
MGEGIEPPVAGEPCASFGPGGFEGFCTVLSA